MAEHVLDLDNVRAGYGETVVLEDIRLALVPSETVSIIGRNGVGKTTLLATIMLSENDFTLGLGGLSRSPLTPALLPLAL